ncbi:hypothetical protein ACS79_15975 [Vibrio lentus]|nr:hypothetical protein ACS79_15975 [Vibrio lentus]
MNLLEERPFIAFIQTGYLWLVEIATFNVWLIEPLTQKIEVELGLQLFGLLIWVSKASVKDDAPMSVI